MDAPTDSRKLRRQIIGIASFFGITTLLFGIKWEWTIAIMGALLVHETGHALMARSRGIRSHGMYFHPLGMVVLLAGDDMKSRDEPPISLAGPIFGMLAAVVSLLAYRATGIMDLAAFAIVVTWINLLNLLPINPLDGGQLARSVVGAISPRAAMAYALLCVIGCLVLGYWNPFFLVVAFLGWMQFQQERRKVLSDESRRGLIAQFAALYQVKPTANAILFARKLRERFPKDNTPDSPESRAADLWKTLESGLGSREDIEKFLRIEPRPPLSLAQAGFWLAAYAVTILSLMHFADMATDIIPAMEAFKMMRH